MIYVLKKTISVSFLSEISAVRKDRFTKLSASKIFPGVANSRNPGAQGCHSMSTGLCR